MREHKRISGSIELAGIKRKNGCVCGDSFIIVGYGISTEEAARIGGGDLIVIYNALVESYLVLISVTVRSARRYKVIVRSGPADGATVELAYNDLSCDKGGGCDNVNVAYLNGAAYRTCADVYNAGRIRLYLALTRDL
jgi:hypothetical protein